MTPPGQPASSRPPSLSPRRLLAGICNRSYRQLRATESNSTTNLYGKLRIFYVLPGLRPVSHQGLAASSSASHTNVLKLPERRVNTKPKGGARYSIKHTGYAPGKTSHNTRRCSTQSPRWSWSKYTVHTHKIARLALRASSPRKHTHPARQVHSNQV